MCPAFDQVAERRAVGGGECGDAGAVHLAHASRRVDLVGEDDQAAASPRGGVGRDLDRGEQVGRAVRTGHGGVTHCTGHHERGGLGVEQIKKVCRLLDAIDGELPPVSPDPLGDIADAIPLPADSGLYISFSAGADRYLLHAMHDGGAVHRRVDLVLLAVPAVHVEPNGAVIVEDDGPAGACRTVTVLALACVEAVSPQIRMTSAASVNRLTLMSRLARLFTAQ